MHLTCSICDKCSTAIKLIFIEATFLFYFMKNEIPVIIVIKFKLEKNVSVVRILTVFPDPTNLIQTNEVFLSQKLNIFQFSEGPNFIF
jgi:hypothetical protein